MMRSDSQRGQWIILILFAVLFFALRFYHLSYQSLWFDEILDWNFIQMDSYTFLIKEILRTAQVPGYIFMMKGYVALVGDSEFALRFLSALMGSLSMFPLFFLSQRLFNREVGYLALSLLVAHQNLIWHAQEARQYTIFYFFSTTAVYFLDAEILRPARPEKRRYLKFFICCLVLSHCHHFGFFFAFFLGFYLLACSKQFEFEVKKKIFLGYLGLGLQQLPWLGGFFWFMFYNKDPIFKQFDPSFKARAFNFLNYYFEHWPLFFIVMTFTLYLVFPFSFFLPSIKKKWGHHKNKLFSLYLWGFAPFLLFWFVQSYLLESGVPPRHFIFSLSALLILLAYFLWRLFPNPKVSIVLSIILALFSTYRLIETHDFYTKINRAPFRQAIEQSLQYPVASKTMLVTFFNQENMLDYYFRDYPLVNAGDLSSFAPLQSLFEKIQLEQPDQVRLAWSDLMFELPGEWIEFMDQYYTKQTVYADSIHGTYFDIYERK